MADSVLKKSFDKKDVSRLRNLLTNKKDNSTNTQSGYNKEYNTHKDNTPFEENGKMWIIEDGIKSNITKLDKLKELTHIPLFCPKCSNMLKGEYDKKMYTIHKKCLNCVAEFETNLKLEGKYEEYRQNIINGNIQYYLNEYEEFLNDIENNIDNSGLISEDGVIEQWLGNNKELIIKAKKQLEETKKLREEQSSS